MECHICLEPVTDDAVVTACGHLQHWKCLYRWLSTGNSSCPVCKAHVTRESVIPVYSSSSSSSAAAAPMASSSSAGRQQPASTPTSTGSGSDGAAEESVPSSASSSFPATSASTAADEPAIPERPRARRPPPPEDPRARHAFWQQPAQAGHAPPGAAAEGGFNAPPGPFHPGGGIHVYSAGFGFFPSLFGLQFQTFGLGAGEGAGGIRTTADGRRVRTGQDGREVAVTPEEERQEMMSRVLLWAGILIILLLLFL